LISDQAWNDFLAKQVRQQKVKKLLESTKLSSAMLENIQQRATSLMRRAAPDEVSERDAAAGASAIGDLSASIGQPLAQLLRRPEIMIEHLVPVLSERVPDFFDREDLAYDVRRAMPDEALPSAVRNELKSVETEIKYEGYLQQQQRAIERLKKAEQRNIPEWFDYKSVSGLSREMQEKLIKIRPRTLGHASRIPGVTPAAVSLRKVNIE